ncbi:MAG: hydrogenase maturation protease [Planctomycetes bacterium]|nr:hydrogenase maturation protease [Planctomycetota bacterium]
MTYRLLVIGYGNELRHDDAVGPLAARAVSDWQAPGVKALAVQQLTPELVDVMAHADTVVFVDAGHVANETVCSRLLKPIHRPLPLGHLGDPCELLALAEMIYHRRPEAWLITVPAPNLEFGEGLSVMAERGLAAALERISFLAGPRRVGLPDQARPFTA